MKECNVQRNAERCTCTWEPCPRKGSCCDCVRYHWTMQELPACLFPEIVEKTYDRSLRRFMEVYKNRV